MSGICPVCNGFVTLQEICPRCENMLLDEGPVQNLFGPYSPYRPIADMQLGNECADTMNKQCIHVITCIHCSHSTYETIALQHY